MPRRAHPTRGGHEMSNPHPTLMWEAAPYPGKAQQLLTWVREVALAELGDADTRLFRSHDDRVVIIATSRNATPPRVTSQPNELVRRPPHQWLFEEVVAHP